MLNRNTPPEFQPTKAISLSPLQTLSICEGVNLFSLSNSNLEVFRLEVVFRAGSYFGNQFGASFFTSKLMPNGTKEKNANQIAEKFEQFGGFLEVNQNQERLIVTLHGLTKYFEKYLPDLVELIFEPTLPIEELEIQKNITKQSYLVNIEKTAVLCNKSFRESLFGQNHAFGKTLDAAEIELINRAEIEKFHLDFIKNAPFNLFLTGNISSKEENLLNKYFSISRINRKNLEIVSPEILPVFKTNIEKENSVQSSIRLGKRMFNRHHKDFFKFMVFNTLFGGYFGSRLMKNIREEKGLTYGINSSLVPLADSGYWNIGTDVNKENVSKAIDEINVEIEKMKHEVVTDEELQLVKNYMKGSILNSTNTVFDIMDKHKAMIHENLEKDFYDNMLGKIDGVSVKDIIEMANVYMIDISSAVVG